MRIFTEAEEIKKALDNAADEFALIISIETGAPLEIQIALYEELIKNAEF